MMHVEIKQEPFSACIEEAKPLLALHWEEVASHKEDIKLEPDYDKYERLDKAGQLLVLTVRCDGVLVGYSAFIIGTHLHYKSCKTAINDVIFLREDLRKGGLGVRLIRESQRALKSVGVDKVTWHVKLKLDWSPILELMGYELEEKIMTRLLKGEYGL